MHVLVTGGAGYIGSHAVKALLGAGHRVTTLDKFSSGHCAAVQGGAFVDIDLADRPALAQLFGTRPFDAVMHFAASIRVGESMIDPGAYFRNNTCNTFNLVDAMIGAGVQRLVYSSTAAVFGEPRRVPIDETHPRAPINAYGESKRFVEDALVHYERAHGLRSVALRYFNAAGADASGELGPRHDPVTHLVPIVLRVALERIETLGIYGDDYPTPDGTCIRDYVHVSDLVDAHLLALDWLDAGGVTAAFNLGNGAGCSVREVVETARMVTGRPIPVRLAPRRVGDPARLVADPTRAIHELRWRPRRVALETIVRDAWRWEQGLAREALAARRLLQSGSAPATSGKILCPVLSGNTQ